MAVKLIDSTLLIDLAREVRRKAPGGVASWFHGFTGPFSVNSVSVGEFLEGEADRAWALGWLKQFSRPIPITSATARIMADIQRGAGKRLGENDAWMAASAIEHGATLLSTDKAFGGVQRLRWHTYGRD